MFLKNPRWWSFSSVHAKAQSFTFINSIFLGERGEEIDPPYLP